MCKFFQIIYKNNWKYCCVFPQKNIIERSCSVLDTSVDRRRNVVVIRDLGGTLVPEHIGKRDETKRDEEKRSTYCACM